MVEQAHFVLATLGDRLRRPESAGSLDKTGRGSLTTAMFAARAERSRASRLPRCGAESAGPSSLKEAPGVEAPPASTRQSRWCALDAMRGIAALLVVIYHLRWNWHGYDVRLVRHGFYAVDFFFVLSGFVMNATYGSMRTRTDLARFAIKRAGRLLPLHFVTLAAFVALELVFWCFEGIGLPAGRPLFAGFTGIMPLLAQAALVFGLIPGLDWTWNHPCWSIAVEFWTYIVFGLTVLAVKRGRCTSWMILSCFGLLAVGCSTQGLASTSGVAMFRCCLSFFLGALICDLYNAMRRRAARVGTTTQLVAVAIAVAAMLVPSASGLSLVIPYVFAALVLSLAFDEGAVARALCARPFIRLGELSFSIYLTHVPLWFAVEGILRLGAAAGTTWLLPDARPAVPVLVSPFGSRLATDALVLAYLGLVLAVSQLTQRWIEVPARTWSRFVADRVRIGGLMSSVSMQKGPKSLEVSPVDG